MLCLTGYEFLGSNNTPGVAAPSAREEGEEKPKPTENQDDGYETSNSGEAARRKPSSAEGSPAPPAAPSPPPDPPYEPLLRHYEPEPEPYRHFEPPAPPPPQPEPQYQHFPFPKYAGDPYAFKREPEVPYDMSQHHQYAQGKRDDDLYNGIKRECDDPYSFVEEEAMCAMLGQPQPHAVPHLPHHDHHMLHPHQLLLNQPKKRGRKKKIKDENGPLSGVNYMCMEMKPEGGLEGVVARPVKERKKHDRFNGMSEEEVSRRTLPDHLAENLDIIIIGINPGLFAAYKGHHYAGPGNHFWKCLYLSGLTREQMSADEDYKLLNFGIGFTNMVARPTKGSADLTRREIKEGSAILLEKLQTFRPKVAVFNGKLIYEVFSGKKDFCFGKQPDTIAGTNTYMWVMPSSSARCAQLPRAADKVPFYAALKKFRDYLNGLVPHVDEHELVFPDNTSRRPQEEMEIRRLTMEPEPGDTIILEDGTEVPLKKKRGRPKKVKLENGEVAPAAPRQPRAPRPPPSLDPSDQPPKKKRGRPKKIRPEEQQFLLQHQQHQQHQQQQQVSGTNAMVQQSSGLSALQPVAGHGGAAHDGYLADFPAPMYHQQHAPHQQLTNDAGNYFQQQPPNSGMESPLEVSAPLGMTRAYGSPGAYGSPRGVYASPRSQGYSPSPARPAGTPQPAELLHAFPASPAAFPAVSPRRLGLWLARAVCGRSPLYAHSPAPYAPQHSPAPPPARYAMSPAQHYSHSPAPVQAPRPYSRSPAPGSGTTPFPAASPAALHSYTPSPAHTPYSQHSSPAPSRTPTYTDTHHFAPQGGSGTSGSGSGSGYGGELSHEIGAAISSPAAASPVALDFEPPRDTPGRDSPMGSTDMHPGSNSNSSLSDYNKTSAGSEMSPAGVGGASFGGALYDGEARLHDHYYRQDQGGGVGDSPRLDQMHQHQSSMYPNNFNRSPPAGGGEAFSPLGAAFRPPDAHTPHTPHTPHDDHQQHLHQPGSPGEYAGAVKPKAQDVASKSLSGLESLVDQIPSIAEGPGAGAGPAPPAPPEQAPAAVAALPDYAPALYPPYGAYGGTAYGNNGYGAPFVGYGSGWGTAVMRPTPGYLSEWQYGYPAGVPAGYAPYNAPYYNGYAGPPPAHHQQAHYLSAPPLIDLHKNGEHASVAAVPAVPSVPSVGFGGFC
ncbi:LOW QUALITY PROTEIN: uncharacterized protein LOC110382226 [Helicoverpa armigera]|uniref:LOW QUALITY PROTEIN: uncharacterized protein LOC110382226 n=1 Tax=Helicoverpa armigera TaxID=29058 RepID=UPI003082AC1B